MSMPPIIKLKFGNYVQCAVRRESVNKHLNVFALNATLNLPANLAKMSHAENKRRMAPAVGKSNATSSAFANAPRTNLQ
jgi:hypothetical protein